MAIFDKAKEKFQGFMQGSEQANRNRRSNGGTSGYRPVRNQNPPQPQQEVPAGAFGGGVMPDTMFGGNAGFESVAATGRQNPSGAVFSEIFSPYGWTAYVDGAEAPCFRADYVLRAMRLPAGQHTVEWKFRAPGWTAAEAVTLVSSLVILLGAAAAIVYWIRQKRKENNPDE